jgi:hypothetical protein
VPEQHQNITARLRATIEEELGTFRHFADVPSTDIEAMAQRLVRTISPLLGLAVEDARNRAA